LLAREVAVTIQRPASTGDVRSLRIGVLLLMLWAAYAFTQVWGAWPEDLAAVYMAGHMIQSGRPDLVYLVTPDSFVNATPTAWLPELHAIGLPEDAEAFPYIYPPLWAALVAPLTGVMGPYDFFKLIAAAQIPLLALGVWLAWRLVRPASDIPFWLWAAFSALLLLTNLSVTVALGLMQPQIAVSVLCLFSIQRRSRGRDWTAGIALAIAAAIKMSPAALVLIFVVERRWHALTAFVSSSALIWGMGWLLAGADLHRDFLATLDLIRDTTILSSINFSVNSMLLTFWYAVGPLLGARLEISDVVVQNLPPAITILSKMILLVALATTLLIARRISAAWRPVFLLFQLTLLLALFGPFSWAHYFLIQILLAPAIMTLPHRNLRVLVSLAILLMGCVSAFLLLMSLPNPVLTYPTLATGFWLLIGAATTLAAWHNRDPSGNSAADPCTPSALGYNAQQFAKPETGPCRSEPISSP